MDFIKLERDHILKQLKALGLKRWWVAEQLGVHQTTLRRWLNGSIETPRVAHLTRLAELLAVPLDEVARVTRCIH